MKIWIASILLLISTSVPASIIIREYKGGAKRYWIIYQSDIPLKQDLVVFLHGYGANNPACYGGWIKSIIGQGNVVLFPKYQSGTFLPRTSKFEKRTSNAILESIGLIREETALEITSISFVSHSLGGIISANLADEYTKNSVIPITNLILVQPGFKYHRLGRKSDYRHLSPNSRVLVITGSNDLTAGRKFADHFWSGIPQIPKQNKTYLNQHADHYSEFKVNSTHTEPISPDFDFDTGNRNAVVSGAFLVGKTDQVDTDVFWRLTNGLLECQGDNCELLQNNEALTFAGKWNKQTPIKPLSILN